jgi:hypothetical protein
MITHKFLRLALIVILFNSCGVIVDYDYEKTTNFSEYNTYNYFTDIQTGLSELDNKRLYRALDTKLKTLGLTKSDNPSFYIDIKSQDVANRSNSNVGIGLGGTGRNVLGGVSIGIPVGRNAASREISIEFVDDSKNGMFWQAISTGSYSVNTTPEKREAKFMALIEKIFSKYPPQK